MKITGYEAVCNLGCGMDSIYEKAIEGDSSCFSDIENLIKGKTVHAGLISIPIFSIIDNKNYNLRCNQLIIRTLTLIENKIKALNSTYNRNKIGIITATTNSGVEEYEKSKNLKHCELGNPTEFLKKHLEYNGFTATVSTACSSGLKAFSLAKNMLRNGICDAIILVCVDSLSKVPLYGFDSLEVLSEKPSFSFDKNHAGMNIGEACSIFIIEKNSNPNGIKVLGIGESSDIYHSTTPDPEAVEVIKAMKQALIDANLEPEQIDYINAHGTGTAANDIMEATAINKIFSDKVPVSSTKSLTGHCLGAAAGIETALCCKLLDNFEGKLYPHILNTEYDSSLPKIRLVKKDEIYKKCNICMCNSFGFGGANAIMILGKTDEQ